MAPISRPEALDLIGRIRGRKLLDGFRGSPPVNRDELARIITALGNVGLAHPRIQEIDVNPLIVTEKDVVAVDATFVIG
jgi:succinyl-CoA synthetase beta subunit